MAPSTAADYDALTRANFMRTLKHPIKGVLICAGKYDCTLWFESEGHLQSARLEYINWHGSNERPLIVVKSDLPLLERDHMAPYAKETLAVAREHFGQEQDTKTAPEPKEIRITANRAGSIATIDNSGQIVYDPDRNMEQSAEQASTHSTNIEWECIEAIKEQIKEGSSTMLPFERDEINKRFVLLESRLKELTTKLEQISMGRLDRLERGTYPAMGRLVQEQQDLRVWVGEEVKRIRQCMDVLNGDSANAQNWMAEMGKMVRGLHGMSDEIVLLKQRMDCMTTANNATAGVAIVSKSMIHKFELAITDLQAQCKHMQAQLTELFNKTVLVAQPVTKSDDDNSKSACDRCGGTGQIVVRKQVGGYLQDTDIKLKCTNCGGWGLAEARKPRSKEPTNPASIAYVGKDKCPNCDGHGVVLILLHEGQVRHIRCAMCKGTKKAIIAPNATSTQATDNQGKDADKDTSKDADITHNADNAHNDGGSFFSEKWRAAEAVLLKEIADLKEKNRNLVQSVNDALMERDNVQASLDNTRIYIDNLRIRSSGLFIANESLSKDVTVLKSRLAAITRERDLLIDKNGG